MSFSIKSYLLEDSDGVPAWRRLLWVCVLGALAAAVGFKVFSARQAGLIVKHWGYYGLAIIFGWWCWAVADLVRSRAAGKLAWWRSKLNRETFQAALLIAVLTGVAVLTVPRVYKILFDEVVIQSTAWNLHMEREVGAVNRAYEIDGLMRSLETYLDKRPFFFPFLVSLLHDATGYRETNAFYLNLSLMPVVLGLLYGLARKLAGHGAALAAVAALGAFPLLALNSQGAGLEMLNMALILGLMLAGLVYLETPDDRSLAVVVLTAVLLANTRYEAGIYIGCAALLLVEGWRRAGRILLPPAALFGPVLLVPYALHNTYLSGSPELWELRAGMTSRFSLEYLVANLECARTFFFNFNGLIANSIWLTLAGLVASVWLGFWGWRNKPRWADWTPVSASVTLCSIGIAGNVALLMAYYWGDLSDPVVSRLSLPLHALLALLLAAAIGRIPVVLRVATARWSVFLALLAYVSFGLKTNQRLDVQNNTEVAQRWEADVLRRRGPASRMVITDKSPLSWFVRDVPAIMPGRLIMKPDSLSFHMRHHTFDEVLITQTLEPAGSDKFWIAPELVLPPNYVLEVIAERRVGAKLHRISLIKEIKVDAPPSNKVSSRS